MKEQRRRRPVAGFPEADDGGAGDDVLHTLDDDDEVVEFEEIGEDGGGKKCDIYPSSQYIVEILSDWEGTILLKSFRKCRKILRMGFKILFFIFL